MQTVNPYLKQYKKNQVETATPEEVLILLYNGAIQYLNKAKIGIEQNNNEIINKNIMACEKIILEFMNTLDMENGGEVAQNLRRLYDYFYRTLVSANLNKDMAKVDEVLRHLKNLRETWQKAIAIAQSQRTASLMDESEIEHFDTLEDEEEHD